MSKIEVDQVDPQSGTTLTLGTSGDTVSIPSGVTLANAGTVTGIPTSALTGTIALNQMATGTDGNIISYDASGNPVAVATGSAGQVLTSAGAGAPPTFAAAGAGGIISSNYASSPSSTSTTSTSFIDTYSPGIAVTPASTSSKFLVIATGSMFNNDTNYSAGLTLFRDSTNLSGTTSDDGDMILITFGQMGFSLVDLDAPNTTSSITYRMKYRVTNASTYARINANNTQSQLVVLEF